MALLNEYINRRLSSKGLEDELLRLIRAYNIGTKSYLIVYASAIQKSIPDIALSMGDYYIIFDLLRNVKELTLDFYIETPGGNAVASEEIVRFLRGKFETVNFIVSGEAKSAGTILVLSGDEIFMTKSGSLGPIDAQIKIGRSKVSAFDYLEWVDQTKKEAEETGKLNPLDATMVAQISPGELNSVYHSLKFAEDLVEKWLPKFKFKNWTETETKKIKVTEEMKKTRAKEIAQELTNHGKWRSHGRSLKIEDLEEIGLKINRIDENPKISDIIYRIQAVIRLLFSSTTNYKVIATADNKIFRSAISRNIPVNIPKQNIEHGGVDVTCNSCNKVHKLFFKFVKKQKIDEDYKNKGSISFPMDNILKCECGFEIDLSGLKNEIESKIGKKMVF